MNNWKDYVGYQPLNEEELPKAYQIVVYTVKPEENGSSLVSQRMDVARHMDEVEIDLSEMTLTEDEVGQAVEDVILTFPTQEIKSIVELQRAKINISRTSRLAPPPINFNAAWYHNGSFTDSAIYVIGYKGQYAVKKHPDFDKYGFVVASEPIVTEKPVKFTDL